MTVTDAEDSAPHVLMSPSKVSTNWLAGLGATFGLGALVSSSCCAVPVALAGLGAGGAVFSGLEFLANWRPYFLGAAALGLLTSWGMFFQRRANTCSADGRCTTSAPTKRTALLLSIGTAFVALSVAWDWLIEPFVFKLVR